MNQSSYHRHRNRGMPLVLTWLVRCSAAFLVIVCIVALVRGGMLLAGLTASEEPQGSGSSGQVNPVVQPGASGQTGPGGVTNPGGVTGPGGTEEPDDPLAPPEPPAPVIRVVIDPGHGGIDPGCSVGSAVEKTIALELALLLQEKLEAQGITTLLTREEDINSTMQERVDLANQTGAELYISLHCNSYEQDERVRGLECYYWETDESLALARLITRQVEQSGVKTRDVKTEEFKVIRDTEMTAVLIETGFLTNEDDRGRLTDPEKQSALMDAVAKAVVSVLGD